MAETTTPLIAKDSQTDSPSQSFKQKRSLIRKQAPKVTKDRIYHDIAVQKLS
jgi:hypothetical protein